MAAQAQAAQVTTIPSPIGGADYFNSLFGMPPENAIQLINWWPDVYGCTVRRGYTVWAADLPGAVHTTVTYHSSYLGQSFLYAVSGTQMFDVTSRDTVSPPPARVPVLENLVSSIWQGVMMANAAGTHKIMVSGEDAPIWIHQPAPPAVVFDRLTAGDGITPGTIQGVTGNTDPPTVIPVDPKNFSDVTTHQRRLWFVEKDTTYGWYLPPDQVYGDARKFDFGPLFKRGGFLQSLATWTVGDGEGSNDLLVAFSSEGDIAVYEGIDPNNVETWALKGVFYAGALVFGKRFHTRVAGDLKFVTQQGLMSMNDMFTSNQNVGPQSNVEAKLVQQFIAEQAASFGFLHGWDLKFIPAINMLILNIPTVVTGGTMQVVENTVNQKWTTFRGMDAGCFCPDYQEVPFFCSGARVCQGWTGHTDEVTIDDPRGREITAVVQQAYNFFGAPGTNKQLSMYRPNFLTEKSVLWKSRINYNFAFRLPGVSGATVGQVDPLWDQAIWDLAIWAGGLHTIREWAQAEGLGSAASLSMVTRSDGELIWVNTDVVLRNGGIL